MKRSIVPLGEAALLVSMGESRIDLNVNERCCALAKKLEAQGFECVPTYASVLVHYNPVVYEYADIVSLVDRVAEALDMPEESSRLVVVPVCYGGEFGEDLPYVAEINALTQDKVVSIHSSAEYRVYMMGFTAGFPYFGGMSEQIKAPRLSTPRLRIPAGSVGIAGNQTGVYPSDTPGGWRMIGRTPLPLYIPAETAGEQQFLFRAGDRVKFQPITKHLFDHLFGIYKKKMRNCEIRTVDQILEISQTEIENGEGVRLESGYMEIDRKTIGKGDACLTK